MSTLLAKQIRDSRKRLGNPYAYHDGDGGYDAVVYEADSPSAEQISESRRIPENQYAHLNDKGGYDAIHNNSDNSSRNVFVLSPKTLKAIKSIQNKKHLSYGDIEQIAIMLQKEMWYQRNTLSLEGAQDNPINLLDPSIALKLIGYDFNLTASLGQFSPGRKMMEVAGLIDTSSKQVSISQQFPNDTQKFTTAHELGHAIMHEAKGLQLHRDRALDGSNLNGTRERIEIEADKFATYFLMPEKLVKKVFKKIYYTDCFSLNEDTLFALGSKISADIEKQNPTKRGLARILAKTESYNGENFISLARRFGVSIETMAIRLEESGLLLFES